MLILSTDICLHRVTYHTFVNMIIQEGLKSDVIHKKYVIVAHPIIQFFIDSWRKNIILLNT